MMSRINYKSFIWCGLREGMKAGMLSNRGKIRTTAVKPKRKTCPFRRQIRRGGLPRKKANQNRHVRLGLLHPPTTARRLLNVPRSSPGTFARCCVLTYPERTAALSLTELAAAGWSASLAATPSPTSGVPPLGISPLDGSATAPTRVLLSIFERILG
jgi:hypothetical protein